MSISPYVKNLREHVGHMRLLIPSVTAVVRDAPDTLLLVRQRDGGLWSTPGGAVEPNEDPAKAVVRETLEETGLIVRPSRIRAAWGGPEFVVRYPNGDEAQYVMTVFDCEIVGGQLQPDGLETIDARFWSRHETASLPLSDWLAPMIGNLYTDDAGAL